MLHMPAGSNPPSLSDVFSRFICATFLIRSTVHLYRILCMVCSTNSVTLLDTYQYDDTAHDYFNREPYCAKFSIQNAGTPAADDLVQTIGSYYSSRTTFLTCSEKGVWRQCKKYEYWQSTDHCSGPYIHFGSFQIAINLQRIIPFILCKTTGRTLPSDTIMTFEAYDWILNTYFQCCNY